MDVLEAERRGSAQARLDRGAALARASQVDVKTQVRVAIETLADTIVEVAQDSGCGLIVLGKHGHGALQQALLGSTAVGVVQRSRVPVLLVPPAAATAHPRAT